MGPPCKCYQKIPTDDDQVMGEGHIIWGGDGVVDRKVLNQQFQSIHRWRNRMRWGVDEDESTARVLALWLTITLHNGPEGGVGGTWCTRGPGGELQFNR